MNDAKVNQYLRDNHYPEHVVRGGRLGLIKKWREFVERVERGYTLGLEDYRNDLDVRAILHAVGVEDAEVTALDERLEKMLTAPKTRVWQSGPDDPFWDFGYPKNAGPELRNGLQEEGLL
jgi:hypothetical protein